MTKNKFLLTMLGVRDHTPLNLPVTMTPKIQRQG